MLRKAYKMVFANQRRLRIIGLTLMLVGLGGFVYVDGLPVKKKASATGDLGVQLNQGKVQDNSLVNQADTNLHVRENPQEKQSLTGPKPIDNSLQGNQGNQIVQPNQQVPVQPVVDQMDQQAGAGQHPGGDGVQQLGAPLNPVQLQQPDQGEAPKPDNQVIENQQPMPAGGAPDGGKDTELHAPPAPDAGAQPKDEQLQRPVVQDKEVGGQADSDHHPIKKALFKDSHLPLKVKDIKPPDHLDGVRLEQDGHLNRDYKKEIFLGEHEDIEQGTEEEQKNKLKEIFAKVDTSQDGFISLGELESWIIQKVEEHFDEAIKENEHVFKALDTDEDGDITWREFHIQFLMAKGHDQKKAEQHMEDYETIPLEPDDKEQLIRFKFRWAEADEDPQDNKLTMVEFRNFRHPEQSENMLLRMVQDILENLDKDHDGIVTQEEFAALPPGEVDEQWKESDRMWQEERRKEFKEVIDLNKDGIVTKDELKKYVDPKNPQHSRLESQNLIELADNNKDNKVSLSEMLENLELFLGSKVVNTGRSFHDEF